MRSSIYIFCIVFILSATCFSQHNDQFEIEKIIKTTPLKDQQSSGTCWSFATTSFIETEALRLGKEPVSMSPIFYVSPAYIGKAKKFVETKGESWLDAGDLTFSVLDAYKMYGAVPETIYNGIIKEDWQHDHVEMDNMLYDMMKSVATNGYGRIKPHSWKASVKGVLAAYLGEAPETFFYNNENHTPKSFAKKYIGINPDDYVEITSYKHHNFYESIILNIPANWNANSYLNLPITDFEKTINNALETGYTLAWDGDATEPLFDLEKGLMRLPDDQEESTISQQLRQNTFEDGTTTDDHNMHIIGTAKNSAGKTYYILKNSEGKNEFDGYVYMSKNALLLKTISVLVHVDAIPKRIKAKSSISEH